MAATMMAFEDVAFQLVDLPPINRQHLRELGRALFDLNLLVRAYSKAPGKEADRSKPFVLHVHAELEEHLQFARVWGRAAFDGPRVPRDHTVEDGEVIELHA